MTTMGERRPRVLAIILAVFTLAAASWAPTGASAQSKPLPKLTISIGSITVQYADLFVAKTEGFFEKAGVDVDIVLNGGQYATAVLTGQADLGIVGAVGILPLVRQGKAAKVVYSTGFGTANGFVVHGNAPYRKMLDLSGRKIAVFQLGQNRGLTQAASNWIVENGGKPLDLAPLATPSGDLSSLVASGIVEGAFVDPQNAAPYIIAGKVKWLDDLNPGSSLMRKFMSADTVGLSVWGDPRRLAEHPEKIARFVAGMRLAERWLSQKSDAEVSASVFRSGFFAGVNREQLEFTMPAYRAMWALKSEGYVSKASWDDISINVWRSFDLGFDPGEAQYNFDNRVDMSFWNGSTEILKELQ